MPARKKPSRSRELRLVARPLGVPRATDWTVGELPVPEISDGEFLVELTHISIDPAMRGWMEDRPSYLPPVALGDVMRASAIGRVIESRNPRFAPGEMVAGLFGVREYAISNGRGVTRVGLEPSRPETWLGALGGSGMTAYFGLLRVGALKPQDTVVVSAAAGAVGGLVGQIARIHHCRVIGVAGGRAKCRHIVDELGFDAAIDYKSQDVDLRLGELCGERGADVYFDNVGGEILDAALMHLAMGARVVLCGAISQYNRAEVWTGPTNYWQLLVRRARIEGFLAFDFAREFPQAREKISHWIASGQLVAQEEVVRGTVADFPDALLKLFRGENLGKTVLEVTAAS